MLEYYFQNNQESATESPIFKLFCEFVRGKFTNSKEDLQRFVKVDQMIADDIRKYVHECFIQRLTNIQNTTATQHIHENLESTTVNLKETTENI